MVVVIDVHVRVACTTLHEERDEALEGSALGIAVKRPEARVDGPTGSVGGQLDESEQVFDAVAQGVRVALEVEEEIARRGLRQHREAATRLDVVQELVAERACVTALDLNARLFPDARKGRVPDPVHRRAALEWHSGEFADGPHRGKLQRAPLSARDARHERKVIVRPAPRVALDGVIADLAVRDRLGIRA